MNSYFLEKMETLKFKTNIKCNNCVSKVAPYLHSSPNISDWNVDLESPDRILTVTGEGITKELVNEALQKAGYKAEDIK